jgi:hypothetical protein
MEEPKQNGLPNAEDLFLRISPYREFSYSSDEIIKVLDLMFYNGILDTYCIGCEKSSTFKSISQFPRYHRNMAIARKQLLVDNEPAYSYLAKRNFFESKFECARKKNHLMIFYFYVTSNTIMKIGQYPSLADFYIDYIGKYRRILGKKYLELHRAIGLSAYEIGIGSFVYLRRIFEHLIDAAREEARQNNDLDEELYSQASRMEDKIDLLQKYLPTYLVKNKVIYSILSKGIHELTEAECMDKFTSIRRGIELILDQRIEKQEREQKEQEISSSLREASTSEDSVPKSSGKPEADSESSQETQQDHTVR